MDKTKNYLILLLIFVFSTNCSFDNKTGIWGGSAKEKKRIEELEKKQTQTINKETIFTYKESFEKEITAAKNVNLSKPVKNLSWIMSGLNYQNSIGNLYLSGVDNKFLKKSIGKNKFTNLGEMSSPIILENNIVFADDKGTIYNIDNSGRIIWKKNIYKKIYKKIYKNLTYSLYDDKIFVSDNVGFIYAISLDNAQLIWIKNHGVPLKSNIASFLFL